MAKRTSKYANMSASELGAETRRRGLTKPEGMVNISEWADFLEAEDAKEAEAPAVDSTEAESAEKPAKSAKAKGKEAEG